MARRLRQEMWRFTLGFLVDDEPAYRRAHRNLKVYSDEARDQEYRRCHECLDFLRAMCALDHDRPAQQQYVQYLAQHYTHDEVREAGLALQAAGLVQ